MAFKTITVLILVLVGLTLGVALLPQSAMNSHGNASSHTGAVVVGAQISLTISSSPSSYSTPGTIITNTYTIKNIGSVNITASGAFTVTDSIIGAFACSSGPLNVNVSTMCTKGYTIVQSNLDQGSISFSGTASGNGATSMLATAPIVTAIQSPALTLSKSPSPSTFTTAGQQIQYTFGVTNSGNVTFPGPFTVTDNTFGSIVTANCTGGGTLNGPLAPTASINCIFNYIITTGDVMAGAHNNQAHVTGSFNSTLYNSASVNAQITCPTCAGVNTISVVAPPYNAACNGTTDDEPAFQNALNAAGSMATPTSQWSVTIPSGVTCLLNTWNFAGGGQSRNITIPSNVTLQTAPGFTTRATILQGGNCPQGHGAGVTGCGRENVLDGGNVVFPQVVGIGNGGQNSETQTPHNVSSIVANSNTVQLSTFGDTSFFNVGDDIYVYDQIPRRSFHITNLTVGGTTVNVTTSGTFPTAQMFAGQAVGYTDNNGMNFNGTLQAGFTSTTASATFTSPPAACTSTCNSFQLCPGCDVQYAQMNKITGINAAAGTLTTQNSFINAFPFNGRQAVVMDVNGIFSDSAGLKNVIIQGGSPISVNQTYGAILSGNTFIVDVSMNSNSNLPPTCNPGTTPQCFYIETFLQESQMNTQWLNNVFTITNATGSTGFAFELWQRNSNNNLAQGNSFGTTTGGWSCYGSGEINGANTWNMNTWYVYTVGNSNAGGCAAAITISNKNSSFTNNTINYPNPTNINVSNFYGFVDLDTTQDSEGDTYPGTWGVGFLQLTGNQFNNCSFNSPDNSNACIGLFSYSGTITGNTIVRIVGDPTTAISNNGSGNNVSGNTVVN